MPILHVSHLHLYSDHGAAMTREIQLTQGAVALVDDEDYERVAVHKWCCNHGYARRCWRVNGARFNQLMHRLVMNAQPGQQVDHINGNKADNRKCNLRFCSTNENQHNTAKHRNNKSGFKGVWFSSASGKFAATIRVNKKARHLGLFESAEEAARAYDKAAIELHGDFAGLNFGVAS